jgi:hypothetical protein
VAAVQQQGQNVLKIVVSMENLMKISKKNKRKNRVEATEQ